MRLELICTSSKLILTTMLYKEDLGEWEFDQWNSRWFSHTFKVLPETAKFSKQNISLSGL